jgi:hypothetical protein
MDVVQRFAIVTLAVSAAVVLPAAATAKQLSSFSACGASGCSEVTDAAELRTLIHAVEGQREPVHIPTPAPASFVRLDFRFKGDNGTNGPTVSQYYVPSRGAILLQTGPDAWTWVRAGSQRPVFDRARRGLEPFPTPTISRVTVGHDVVLDTTRLFSAKATTYTVPDEPDWVPVRIQTNRPSPWSAPAATLEYSPSTHVLWRGTEFVKLSTAVTSRQSGSFPWIIFLGAALIVPGAFFARRRRRRRA